MELRGKEGLVLYCAEDVMKQVGWMSPDGRLWTNKITSTDNMIPVWVRVDTNGDDW